MHRPFHYIKRHTNIQHLTDDVFVLKIVFSYVVFNKNIIFIGPFELSKISISIKSMMNVVYRCKSLSQFV